MATEREGNSYSQFNFQVTLGDEGPERPQAGFQETSGLGLDVTVTEFRGGNSSENAPIKVTFTPKVPYVTLKRGAMACSDLYQWLHDVRTSSQGQRRTVRIDLMSEDRVTVAKSWKLTNARPIRYTAPSLNGGDTEIAIEELVLAADRIEIA